MVVCIVSEGTTGLQAGNRMVGYHGCGSCVVVSTKYSALERGGGTLTFRNNRGTRYSRLGIAFRRTYYRGFVSHCRKQGMNMHPTQPPIPSLGSWEPSTSKEICS